MSARSKARKQSLDLLYEADIRGKASMDLLALRDVAEEGPDARPIREYTKILISGVDTHKRKIDELISTYAQGWDMDRLPAVDRNVLRIGIYEILWQEDVPDAVAIDEALALAKELSTEESSGYIHGVLGRIASIRGDLNL
ncbi:MAG: transcription antitermination factor NusB [Actinomycetes bacterium]